MAQQQTNNNNNTRDLGRFMLNRDTRQLPGFLGDPFTTDTPSWKYGDDWDLYRDDECPPSVADIERMRQLWESMMSSVDAARRNVQHALEVLEGTKRSATVTGQFLRAMGVPIPYQGHALMDTFPPYVHPYCDPRSIPTPPPSPPPAVVKQEPPPYHNVEYTVKEEPSQDTIAKRE
jgi:hypothetical protein